MNLRQLRIFVAAAEAQNFTRAAAMTRTTQQNVSKLIGMLEQDLGGRVFERSRRGVILTDLGRSFREGAEQILEIAEHARNGARRSAGRDLDRLRVGFPKHGVWILAPLVLKTFRRQRPKVSLELREFVADRRLAAVRDDFLDVAFIFTPADDPPLDRALIGETLYTEPVSVVLPAAHPLAGLEEIDIASLAGEDIVRWERQTNAAVFDRVVDACREAGFEPRFANYMPEAVTRDIVAALVSSHAGLVLTFASFMDLRGWPGIAVRNLAGGDRLRFRFVLVRGRAEQSRVVEAFVRMVRTVVRNERSSALRAIV
jgi:DNA-binding transcriptional LysR family regulator